MAKAYNHFCGIAKAFEVLGERWTPLIVRELMLGGRRFSDLLEGLPGVGTSTLTDRLKHLQREDVVARKVLPPPAASIVYELTESGRSLARSMLPLAVWGARRLPPIQGDTALFFQTRWLLVWLFTAFEARNAVGLSETYEIHIDDEIYRLEVKQGELDLKQTLEPGAADLTIRTTFAAVMDGVTGRRTVQQILRSDDVEVQGQNEVLMRCVSIFLPAWLQELSQMR